MYLKSQHECCRQQQRAWSSSREHENSRQQQQRKATLPFLRVHRPSQQQQQQAERHAEKCRAVVADGYSSGSRGSVLCCCCPSPLHTQRAWSMVTFETIRHPTAVAPALLQDIERALVLLITSAPAQLLHVTCPPSSHLQRSSGRQPCQGRNGALLTRKVMGAPSEEDTTQTTTSSIAAT